jgi:(p)ppGpp synthase/HD superfamily hydrolase
MQANAQVDAPPIAAADESIDWAAVGRGEFDELLAFVRRQMPGVQTALIEHAYEYAATAHAGQRRKSGEPYIFHPIATARILAEMQLDPETIAAALLHDVIEDTTADYDDVEREFGPAVADVVAALTKDMRRPNDAREVEYDRQLAAAQWQARLVKLADVYDNVSDCVDEAMRKKAIAKARRAVALADEEPQVRAAARQVEILIGGYDRE